jgi:hypothetical protein
MFRQRKHKIQKSMKKNNFFRGMLPILAVGVMALAGTSLTSCSRSSDDELVVPQTPSVSVQDVVGTWKLTKYERKDTDGVYKTGAVTALYKVYTADGTYKNYHNAAPNDPTTFEGDEGKFELKDGKIFNISKNAGPGDPVFSFKIEVNGNTMIQTKTDDSARYTFTKQ